MSDTGAAGDDARQVFLDRWENGDLPDNKYTKAALERHKREGVELAVRARWIAMAVIAVLLVILNPHPEVLYYHFILALIALNGWFIRRFARVGQSRAELALLFVDLLIMTLGMVIPNPFSDDVRPVSMQYWFENFQYFFVILAGGTLAYSWRTVIAIGTWTTGLWTLALVCAWYFSTPVPGLTEAGIQAFGGYPDVLEFMDPNSFQVEMRFQEMAVFMIVAVTLGVSVRRFNRLLMSNAGLERERANLSRYFSPNVVEQLSQNDDPLKQVRSENVAVMFIDIVGFTKFAAEHSALEVIEVLRGFHSRMEAEVFRHNGTLDKYLGDGLMATFGTPVAGDRDAYNALECAKAMLDSLDAWNVDRRAAGEPEIKIGIGIHFGEVVLGDIGANRLEFAVIGNSVNVASRLEALTRGHHARLVISDDLHRRAMEQGGAESDKFDDLEDLGPQPVRGLDQPVPLWKLA